MSHSSPCADMYDFIRRLEDRGLTGLELWYRIVKFGYPHLLGMARVEIARRGAVGRIEPEDVSHHLIAWNTRRYRRAAAAGRVGGKVFSKGYKPPTGPNPQAKFLVGGLNKETGHLVGRLLAKQAKTTGTATYTPAVADAVVDPKSEQGADAINRGVDLMAAVNALSDLRRALVVGHYLLGEKVENIAAAHGICRTYGYEELARAKDDLRGLLGE